MNTIRRDFAYGRNAVYTQGHHGNAILPQFPIVHFANHDMSAAHREAFVELTGCLARRARGAGRCCGATASTVAAPARAAHSRWRSGRARSAPLTPR